jgi:hypothetical protein
MFVAIRVVQVLGYYSQNHFKGISQRAHERVVKYRGTRSPFERTEKSSC